jgi:hypothetical protein
MHNHSSLANDLRLAFCFALLFISMVLAIGILLAGTAIFESAPLLFPLSAADGAIPLTRAFCLIPK